MMDSKLFSECMLGDCTLKNRVVMAPMTRCRATAEHVPTPVMIRYYSARASAGFIITEGTSPSPHGLGYARIPGIFSAEQVQAWKLVTDAVHNAGGKIFVQLMHTGRVSHPLNLPAGARIIAPSAVAMSGTMWTDQQGMQPYPAPEAMSLADIKHALQEFTDAAGNAIAAGFDGVELHGANGYLIDQFLNAASNQRADEWGGSVAGRIRFAVKVAGAVVGKIGAQRVGMRVSPYGVFNDMQPDADMDAVYASLADELNRLGLAYIHVVDHSAMGAPPVKPEIKKLIQERFKGAFILSGGYDAARASADLAAGLGDLVAFGRPFIANPDLVDKMKRGADLTPPDPDTFYTPGEKGYTDYPL